LIAGTLVVAGLAATFVAASMKSLYQQPPGHDLTFYYPFDDIIARFAIPVLLLLAGFLIWPHHHYYKPPTSRSRKNG